MLLVDILPTLQQHSPREMLKQFDRQIMCGLLSAAQQSEGWDNASSWVPMQLGLEESPRGCKSSGVQITQVCVIVQRDLQERAKTGDRACVYPQRLAARASYCGRSRRRRHPIVWNAACPIHDVRELQMGAPSWRREMKIWKVTHSVCTPSVSRRMDLNRISEVSVMAYRTCTIWVKRFSVDVG